MSDGALSLALAGAAQATLGAAALVNVAREGPQRHDRVFEEDTIEQLADATKLAIEAELAAGHELDEERNQLYGALCNYLEFWA